MDNIKDNIYYAHKAIENIDIISKYCQRKKYDDFINDQELIDAVMFRLIQLVENIKNINQDFKEKNKHIKWGNIIGVRYGIVHEYGKTDYKIVYEIVSQDLSKLRKTLLSVFN